MTVTAVEARVAQPAYRAFEVEVARTRRLSPSFLRMTFTGADLDEFAAVGLDQRIKLVLPAACGLPVSAAAFTGDDWYAAWRDKPDTEREALRTYTVRAVRPAAREVDVDLVLHGVAPEAMLTRGCGLAPMPGCVCSADAGPAVRWCAAARPGDRLVLIGPNALYDGPPSGVEWRPPAGASTYLLAGDETAVPAICSILERLPAGSRAHAYLEIPTEEDVLDVEVAPGVQVHWLPRAAAGRPGAGRGVLLGEHLRAGVRHLVASQHAGVDPEDVDVDSTLLWDVPDHAAAPDGLYAWIAGEAGVVRDLRRHLVRDVGVDRRAVAFMGYWRTGRAEG